MAKRWKYSGDTNLTYGGFFYQESDFDDFVYCVEIIPFSDMGGADNLFIVQNGSIYLPLKDKEKLKTVLSYIGTTPEAATRSDIIHAFKDYHGMEVDSTETVQIGKELDSYTKNESEPEPDKILRGNAKLKNYVRREYLG